jgi:glutamyl-tRNA synthetase
VGSSPATFDYEKLTWMNGVYLRNLPAGEYADTLLGYLREVGFEGDEATIRRAAPLVQEKIETLGRFPEFAGFLFRRVEPDLALLDGSAPVLRQAREALAGTKPFSRERIEEELRALCERLELKPRHAFQPIRVAVTGSKVSPGLFESLELLGRAETLARLDAAISRA